MVCERCSQDIAPVRTFDYVCNELHYAKCVFGSLARVELPEAQSPSYLEDKDFVDLYLEDYDNLRKLIRDNDRTG
jgi:hypothetical protein